MEAKYLVVVSNFRFFLIQPYFDFAILVMKTNILEKNNNTKHDLDAIMSER